MVPVIRTNTFKPKPTSSADLGFGKIFTDYMFTMEYNPEEKWHNAKIEPYSPISLDPAAVCFHYGQEVFEGMKAYRADSERIFLFRPRENLKRLNSSCERICIPKIDEEFVLSALKDLIKIEKKWVPEFENSSLYIRPFIIATTPFLGVKPADHYKFIIILSPSGNYYEEGINPISVYVETSLVRAVKGGTGEAKTGGNYAGSLLAQSKAIRRNCSQVLWLDAVQHKYVEEVGAMNIFFVIDGKIVTPSLSGTILPGITRQSVIDLFEFWNIPVDQRRISIEEVYRAKLEGKLSEVFGTGTAAVVSPIGKILYDKKEIVINEGKTGEVTKSIYNTLTDLQYERIQDVLNWREEVKVK